MTLAKAAGLTAGFLGAFGLGVAVGPSIVHRDAATPTAMSQPAAAPDDVKAPEPAARPTRAPRPTKRAEVSANRAAAIVPPAAHPELQQRLKPVLNRGADMSKASDGFRSAEEFATVAHAARNTQIPFMLLKHRVLEEGMPLDAAIRASKADADAKAEVAKARAEAKSDVSGITS